MSGRWQVSRQAAGLERTAKVADRRATAAATRVAERALAGSTLDEKYGASTRVLAVREAERRLAGWSARLATSFEQDRADYAIVSALGRWLVVARGMLDRFVLRERVRFSERELRARKVELGAHLIERADAELRNRVAAADIDEALEARGAATRARTERSALLAPYGGHAWPAIVREVQSFGRFMVRETRTKLVPRAPALVGLVVGWLVGQLFTDSWWGAVKFVLGFGSAIPVSSETLESLQFWAPIVAAALFAYLGAFIAGRVHRRYTEPLAAEGPSA